MAFRTASIFFIGKAIGVSSGGDERFNVVERNTFHRRKFGHFDKPSALKSIDGVRIAEFLAKFNISSVQKIFNQIFDEMSLADALIALKNRHILVLATRIKNSGNGGDKEIQSDFAAVGRIFNAEIVDKKFFSAINTVPSR